MDAAFKLFENFQQSGLDIFLGVRRSKPSAESRKSPDSSHDASAKSPDSRRDAPAESWKSSDSGKAHLIDLGQGVGVYAGEPLYLFLSKASKLRGVPEGSAEFREDGGLYLGGRKVQPSRGSAIQPAMQAFQARLNHRNEKGEMISLSAWRQWNVKRDGKFLSLDELKDPALAHKRKHRLYSTDLSAEDLDL
jgi:hypothetical protein